METLLFDVSGHVAKVTINRPKVLNALSPQVYQELYNLFSQIASRRDVRVAIITGAGEKAFSAGADISAMVSLAANEARALAQLGHRVANLISFLPQPVIAAINGLALGGGCELALACDLRVASTSAKLGQPEINLAVIPGGGGTQRLTHLVGVARAKELIFTGRVISAEEAFQIGLVNRVVEPAELMPTAEKLAEDLCAKGPIALALAKAAINQSVETSLGAGLTYEIECFASCFATQDQKEGMRAFLEKRSPKFEGV